MRSATIALVLPAGALAQVPTPTPSPAITPAPTPPPSSPNAHVSVRRQIAAGARLDVRLKGLTKPARLEIRRHGRWRKAHPGRAPGRPTVLRLRGVGADGSVTPVKRLRVRYVRLAAVGDVNFGDGPGTAIAVNGPDYPWASVGAPLRAADIAFANLECAVSRRGSPIQKEFTFRGPPSSLKAAARKGGLDVVNLANNHAGDYGDTALLDTLRYSRRFGIVPVGAGSDAAHAYRPRYVHRLGLTVGFVGFSTILPFEFRAGTSEPGTAWGFPDEVRKSVREARRHADVVIATFHWGIERDFHQNAREVALAHVALKAGATAIVAGHPHVQQQIVRRPRKVIAYSLGNFVFSANTPGTEATGILHLALARRRVARSHFQRATIVNSRPLLHP